MKFGIAILTYNASAGAQWIKVLEAIAFQSIQFDKKLIIDSESDDNTCQLAQQYGWECEKISHADFNHGATRNLAVERMMASDIDVVVFLSQDVVLASPDALSILIDFLVANPVAGCYGRQCCRDTTSLDFWQRSKYYSEVSQIKTLKDVPSLGLLTPFFSDAFAAWKIADIKKYGGFPSADFGEDMLLASKILNHEGAIGYCAQACAYHDHSYSLVACFNRGRQVGRFHARHTELLKQYGTVQNPPGRMPSIWLWPAIIFKIAGYCFGRIFHGV